MLIPAAIVGVIVFLYGCATVDDNIPRYTTHTLTQHSFVNLTWFQSKSNFITYELFLKRSLTRFI